MSLPTYRLTDNDVLYFLHIPKTAGMTFTDLIKGHFSPAESNVSALMDDFLKLPRQEIENYKFVAGHFFYNLDELVKRHVVYITMLRDPVERTISHYAHLCRQPSPAPNEIVKSLSLLEFARDPRTVYLYANLQTRFIGADANYARLASNIGIQPYTGNQRQPRPDALAVSDFFNDELLARAKARMSDFAFVGLTEQFDESIELLCRTFGWQQPPTSKLINVGTNRPTASDISEEALEVIRENNKLDYMLYDYGKQLFLERYGQIKGKDTLAASPNTDDLQATLTAMERKIILQEKAIHQLGSELQAIQNSFGWRFVLRINALRQKFIPRGSKIENIYLKVRGR